MPLPVPARWDPSASLQHVARVEVWSRGELVTDVEWEPDVMDGSVSDKWVTGIRRTLDLEVPPTGGWLKWLRLPGLELRPFAGFNWGRSEFLCPMGRFPVLPPQLSLPVSSIRIQADDYWSWVAQNVFLWPTPSLPGLIRDNIAALITDSRLDAPVVTASSIAGLNPMVWERSVHDAVAEMCWSIYAEAFIDRAGVAVVQDRVPVAGAPFTDGESGTLTGLSTAEDFSGVYNQIGVHSTNTDVVVAPVFTGISDPGHPAHHSKIGYRGALNSSSLFTTREQMIAAADVMLSKLAAPALGWSASALSDPSRDAGDLVSVTTEEWGTVQAVILDVKHSLSGDEMTVKLGAP